MLMWEKSNAKLHIQAKADKSKSSNNAVVIESASNLRLVLHTLASYGKHKYIIALY